MFFKNQKAVVERRNHSRMVQAFNPKLGGGSYKEQEGSLEANLVVTGYGRQIGQAVTLPCQVQMSAYRPEQRM